MIKKHGCLLSYCSKITAEWLSTAIHILRKMPRKSDESSVKCYGYVFVIAGRSSGSIEESRSMPAQSKTNNLLSFTLRMTVPPELSELNTIWTIQATFLQTSALFVSYCISDSACSNKAQVLQN